MLARYMKVRDEMNEFTKISAGKISSDYIGMTLIQEKAMPY